jgi:AbrB family looped-hinge helix DNA binding protein
MTERKALYRTRLRPKGQITLPTEVRKKLGVREGDDLAFYLDDQGQMIVTRLQVTFPSQSPNQVLVWDVMQASRSAFAKVWDNDEDAIYDQL